ncbi:MAG: recombinase family protein [Flavobacteriia bacterium]|nr:recombinase family protein [Flavobacteriia bacterium]
MSLKVIIFSRVSTLAQDYQRQTAELLEYADKMGYSVEKVFEEKISGAKKNEERKELMAMMSYIKKNHIEKVLTWELSRIGRNAIQVLQVIEMLNEAKISLYIKNYNLETLNPNGTVNPLSQFMVQILNSVNEMERQTIVQRLRSGYSAARSKGVRVGRKTGVQVKSDDQFLKENKEVAKLLKQGFSVRKVMKLTDRSSGTVQKVKKLIAN